MIFESHAHYDDEAFDEDRKELLDALPAQGIGRVINVCAEVEGWDRTRGSDGTLSVYLRCGGCPSG